MKQLLLFLTLTIIGLQSCNVGTSEFLNDENIDQELKNEIAALDKKVLEAAMTNNTTLIRTIMSEKLMEKIDENIDQLFEQANKVITTTDYQILNQFHVKNSKTGIVNTVMSGINGPDHYVFNYLARNEEMFISLIISKSKLNKFIITNIYGKYPDGWKLNILIFGQYTINGQSATQLYSTAKSDFDKGYFVDAANNMYLSSLVAKPANTHWKYQQQDEMNQFYKTVMSKISKEYTFPLTMDVIKTKPQIFNIYPIGLKEGHFTMIEYITNIDLKDTIRTKEENDLIHQSIGQMFKGIDVDKKLVLYKAYNEMPNGKTPVPNYGFGHEIK